MNQNLSPREQEVLQLFSEGLSEKEIAYRLSLSYRTVEHHVERIISKLGVTNRIQALVKAIREGILK